MLLLQIAYIVSGLMPFVSTGAWWVRFFDFPRLHLFLIGVLLVGLEFGYSTESRSVAQWGILIGMLAITCYQGFRVLRFTPFYPVEVASASPADREQGYAFSAFVSNVCFENENYEAALNIIKNEHPDWLVLLEVHDRWVEELGELKEIYPHTILEPQEKGTGIALYSKFPFERCEIQYLVSPDRPSIYCELRISEGRIVKVWAIHPAPPGLPTEEMEIRDSRPRDAELIVLAKKLRSDTQPCLVVGDFNDAAWSHTTRLFKRISGLKDPRVGRAPYTTYPAHLWLLQFPIDHVFLSSHFSFAEMHKVKFPGSDHLGLTFEVHFAGESKEEASELNGKNQQESREIVEKGKEQAQKYAKQERNG